MFKYPFPLWDLLLWAAVLGAAFVLEFMGIFGKDAPLTRILCATIPCWLRAMICGWMFYHFVIQNPGS